MPSQRLLSPLLKFGPKTIEVCITIDFCPLKRIPGRKTKAKSIYYRYLIMHMGRKLIVLWDEGELGNSVRLFSCFCCCCCPSQCAVPTQSAIGLPVRFSFPSISLVLQSKVKSRMSPLQCVPSCDVIELADRTSRVRRKLGSNTCLFLA